MGKFIYKQQDYHFEVDDGEVDDGEVAFGKLSLQASQYEDFVRNCRKLIKEDKDNNKTEREALIGSKDKN
jgi:hypothetical protein